MCMKTQKTLNKCESHNEKGCHTNNVILYREWDQIQQDLKKKLEQKTTRRLIGTSVKV